MHLTKFELKNITNLASSISDSLFTYHLMQSMDVLIFFYIIASILLDPESQSPIAMTRNMFFI